MDEQDCYIDKIFITHAHFDHMQGAQDVIDLMVKNGHPAPQVLKFKDGNSAEMERLQEKP